MGQRTAVPALIILASAPTASLIPVVSSPLRLGSQQAEVRELLPGAPIERELKGGEAHSYRITLAADQYLHAVVHQRGIDLVVTVFGPDGQTITEIDSSNSSQGPEPVTVVAEAPGDYRLEVRANEFWRQEEESLREQTASGRYEVWIKELRATIPEDRPCFAAKRDLAEGSRPG